MSSVAPEISAPGGEHAEPIAKSGFQKRIDKITREKHELRQTNGQLKAENEELRQVLGRYEDVIRKYKAALVEARGNKI